MPGFEIIDKKEKIAVNQIFDEGGVLFAHGFQKYRKKYHVREFELDAKKKLGSKYAVAVTSGTSATLIALKALGIKRGDEVITQAFNFIATVEAIIESGAKPVMVNIDNSYNMCPIELKKSITKKTKAIIPVHMLGVSAKMNEILKIAKAKKIPILEDNCEAMGAKYNNKYLACVGDVGVVSFDYGKTITTGEGGMIFTNNKKIFKYCKEYHDHGHELNPKYPRGMDTKTITGFNYRMTELQAVIGKVQLKKLDYIINENKKRYNTLFNNIKKTNLIFRLIPKNTTQIYDTLIVRCEDKKIRKKIVKLLNEKGFGTKNLPDAIKWHCAFFWGHALNSKQIKKLKKTKKLLENSIAIPIWLKKTSLDYNNLSKKIKNITNDKK
jgi:8-amino-3,8-dideoxy-alpha-D-manno-octulosonate transaminase